MLDAGSIPRRLPSHNLFNLEMKDEGSGTIFDRECEPCQKRVRVGAVTVAKAVVGRPLWKTLTALVEGHLTITFIG
jgi:hypothetical protein